MANGKIFEIGKKPLSIKDIQAQYMGLIKLNNSGTTIFKKLYEEALMGRLIQGKHVSNAYMTDFLQEIIDSGFTVDAIQSNEDWIEIDSPEDLKLEITSNRLINIIQQTNLI